MRRISISSSNQHGFNNFIIILGLLFVAIFALIGIRAIQVISARPSTPAPTINISALPNSVAYGAKSQLVWTTANANTCTATGGWSGTRPPSGKTYTGNLTANTTYGLTCSGPGGDSSGMTSVTISANSNTQ